MKLLVNISLTITLILISTSILSAQISGETQPLKFENIRSILINCKKDKRCNTTAKLNTLLIKKIDLQGIDFVISEEEQNELKELNATRKIIKLVQEKGLAISLNEINYIFRKCEPLETCNKEAVATNNSAIRLSMALSSNKAGVAFYNKGFIAYREGENISQTGKSDEAKIKYNEAIGDFLTAINDHNYKDEYIYELLGRCEYLIGNYEDAIKFFNVSINNYDKNFVIALNNRGITFAEKKDYESAIKDYTKAIELNSKYGTLYNNRGNIYYEKKDYDSAIKDYTRAIEFDPKLAEAFYNRGVCFNEKKELELALYDFTKAIELNSKFAEAYNNRGVRLSADKKDYDSAIKDFTRAIELNSKFAAPYHGRGFGFAMKKDYDSAIKDYNTAIELDSNYVEVYSNRGNIFYEKNDYDSAIKDLNKAIELDPKFAEAYNNRGRVFAAKKENDLAIKDFTQAIKLNSNIAEVYNNRGAVFTEKKDYDSAINDYTEAIRINPNLAETYYNRGLNFLYKGGDFSSKKENDFAIKEYNLALEDFNKSIGINPNIAQVYNNRGMIFALKDDLDKALIDNAMAIKLEPTNPLYHKARALIYGAFGKKEEAATELKKAEELTNKQMP